MLAMQLATQKPLYFINATKILVSQLTSNQPIFWWFVNQVYLPINQWTLATISASQLVSKHTLFILYFQSHDDVYSAYCTKEIIILCIAGMYVYYCHLKVAIKTLSLLVIKIIHITVTNSDEHLQLLSLSLALIRSSCTVIRSYLRLLSEPCLF